MATPNINILFFLKLLILLTLKISLLNNFLFCPKKNVAKQFHEVFRNSNGFFSFFKCIYSGGKFDSKSDVNSGPISLLASVLAILCEELRSDIM